MNNIKTKYIAYIATTKDGFIADKKGAVSFLDNLKSLGYENFYKSIDGLIYGSSTYKTIINFNLPQWPYKDKKQWVLTSKPEKYNKNKDIVFINAEPSKLIQEIKNHKRIWIMGGAKVINNFINFLDKIIIFQAKDIILKEGIKLFNENALKNFKLIKEKYNGDFIEKHYVPIDR